jgi:serine/threonine-protein kinase RsbW
MMGTASHAGGVSALAEQRSFRREVGCLDEIFDFISDFIEGHELESKVEFAVNFVVEELFTNMVKYNTGKGEDIDIRIDKQGSEIHLELVDHDVDPFDPSQLPDVDTTKSADERVPGGLGIHLVKSIVDRITYSYDQRTMKVMVVKSLES